MSRVSYIQRYSQKENLVTNNTLWVLRFFYQRSPRKLEAILSTLADDDLEVGLNFEQQIKCQNGVSIPDARIDQQPLSIYFETKRDSNLDKGQIERHIESIAANNQNGQMVLFGLTKSSISSPVHEELCKKAKKKEIRFFPITFHDVVEALQACCEPHETDLLDIVEDYKEYLRDEELLVDEIMTVFPCVTSFDENKKHCLCFESPSRSSRARPKFIGIYKDKKVHYVCQVEKVIVGRMEGEKFKVEEDDRDPASDEDLKRIQDAIRDCSYYPQLSKESVRYYLFKRPIEETEFRKNSKYSVRNRRVFLLSELFGVDSQKLDAKEVAKRLRDKEF